MHIVQLTYSDLTIAFTSVKLRRQELNTKTYDNDKLIKICKDESKKEHLLLLQDKYYKDKERVDGLYFKLQEYLDQIV